MYTLSITNMCLYCKTSAIFVIHWEFWTMFLAPGFSNENDKSMHVQLQLRILHRFLLRALKIYGILSAYDRNQTKILRLFLHRKLWKYYVHNQSSISVVFVLFLLETKRSGYTMSGDQQLVLQLLALKISFMTVGRPVGFSLLIISHFDNFTCQYHFLHFKYVIHFTHIDFQWCRLRGQVL